MKFEKLEEAHDRVKNHPFRLDHSDWKGYYNLLKELDKEFCDILEEKYNKDYSINFHFFLHEISSAIFYFSFEFSDEGREGIRGRSYLSAEKHGENYGKIVPEYQKKIVIVLENYIQQIHKFITTRGCFGKSRWNKYKVNREMNKFEWAEKLK